MADNDEASGSRQKQYWEMSMDDEHHEPHYEGILDDSTNPEYTNDSGDDCGATKADPTTNDGSQHTDGQATDGSQPKRKKNGQAPEQARHHQGGIYRGGKKWTSNGARTFSRWVRRTTRVHPPGHRLDQHRKPKASRPSKCAQPPLHEAAQLIQVPRSIRKHKPLRE